MTYPKYPACPIYNRTGHVRFWHEKPALLPNRATAPKPAKPKEDGISDADESELVNSDTAEPPNGISHTASPDLAQSETAESGTAESKIAESETANSHTASPDLAQSETGEPETAEPETAESETAESETANLDTASSNAAKPKHATKTVRFDIPELLPTESEEDDLDSTHSSGSGGRVNWDELDVEEHNKHEALAAARDLVKLLQQTNISGEHKRQIMTKLEKVRTSVQTPQDAINHYTNKVLVLSAIKEAIDHGVFDACTPGNFFSPEVLAARLGLDKVFLARMLRVLALEGIFMDVSAAMSSKPRSKIRARNSVGADAVNRVYAHTNASLALQGRDLFTFVLSETLSPIFALTRTSAADQGHRKLTVAKKKLFLAHMLTRWHPCVVAEGRFPWKTVAEETRPAADRAMVVEIFGGNGDALREIQSACGQRLGMALVLEDRLEVLAGCDSVPGIFTCPYNPFEDPEQPIKGAHVYYFRRLLHLLSNSKCLEILRATVAAMGPKSRVVISEYIMPTAEEDSIPLDMRSCLMDLLVSQTGGHERTEYEWRQMLNSVGLNVVEVWRNKDDPLMADMEAIQIF